MIWLSKVKTSAAILLGAALAVGATGLTYRVLAADGPTPPPFAPQAPEASAQPDVAPLAATSEPAPDPKASYRFTIDAAEVYEFPTMQVGYRDFKLTSNGPVLVLPMKTERGIAGAMLLGTGDFVYHPEPGKTIAGHQRAVMLRFNPDDQASILPLDRGTKLSDQGAAELSRHLLSVVVNHCWQRGGRELLIPPRGTLAAVLYSREHGDLLISFDDKSSTAYNFTTRATLYEKK